LLQGGVQEALEFLDGRFLIGAAITVFHNEVIEEFEELLARIRSRSFSREVSEKELQHVNMRGIVGSLGFRERFNWSTGVYVSYSPKTSLGKLKDLHSTQFCAELEEASSRS